MAGVGDSVGRVDHCTGCELQVLPREGVEVDGRVGLVRGRFTVGVGTGWHCTEQVGHDV